MVECSFHIIVKLNCRCALPQTFSNELTCFENKLLKIHVLVLCFCFTHGKCTMYETCVKLQLCTFYEHPMQLYTFNKHSTQLCTFNTHYTQLCTLNKHSTWLSTLSKFSVWLCSFNILTNIQRSCAHLTHISRSWAHLTHVQRSCAPLTNIQRDYAPLANIPCGCALLTNIQRDWAPLANIPCGCALLTNIQRSCAHLTISRSCAHLTHIPRKCAHLSNIHAVVLIQKHSTQLCTFNKQSTQLWIFSKQSTCLCTFNKHSTQLCTFNKHSTRLSTLANCFYFILDCKLPSVPNAKLYVDHLTHGSQLQVNCNLGYTLTGSSVLTCENGVWSGHYPACLISTGILQFCFAIRTQKSIPWNYLVKRCIIHAAKSFSGAHNSIRIALITSLNIILDSIYRHGFIHYVCFIGTVHITASFETIANVILHGCA